MRVLAGWAFARQRAGRGELILPTLSKRIMGVNTTELKIKATLIWYLLQV
jgi:hypothetical protein